MNQSNFIWRPLYLWVWWLHTCIALKQLQHSKYCLLEIVCEIEIEVLNYLGFNLPYEYDSYLPEWLEFDYKCVRNPYFVNSASLKMQRKTKSYGFLRKFYVN